MNDDTGIFAPDTVQALAKDLFPDSVAVSLSFPWEGGHGLFPEEASSLPNAIEKRLNEFAAGRRAAHQAMRDLGLEPAAIPHHADRSPVWPGLVSGSISHTENICLAALGLAQEHAALGLDIEDDTDLPADLWPVVGTSLETAWLSVQPEEARGRLARLIFSSKECAYKLQYPLTGQVLDFDAFEITPDLETGQFEATLTRDVGPFPARTHFPGRFAFGAGLVLTGMALPHTLRPN